MVVVTTLGIDISIDTLVLKVLSIVGELSILVVLKLHGRGIGFGVESYLYVRKVSILSRKLIRAWEVSILEKIGT